MINKNIMATINDNFLNRLISLLNSEVRTKTKEEREAEEFCDALKWKLTRCFEETLKIDALPDDFELAPFISEHINAPIERMKLQIEKPWLKSKLTIGLLGHFNVGKTTALNLILSENLPTNEDENTALAAYLINGNQGEMSIVTKSGQTLALKEEDSKVLDYADGLKKFPFARIFDYIVKENGSDLLNYLTFIDTPGLGKNLEHSEPTISALKVCDAIIWFIKTPNSISKKDIDFLKENIGGRSLYIVLSFIDDTADPEKATSVIKERLNEADIKVNEYFTLGYSNEIQTQFSSEIISCLKSAADNHDAYNPYAHIYNVVNFLENLLTEFKKGVTKEYNKLDKSTDNLLDAYRTSRQTFVTEFNTCCRIMSNVIDTFNDRCSGATFCGGASNAICNLLNSYQSSFRRMSEADDAIDYNKLVEFGQETSQMNFFNLRGKQASDILEDLQSIKKIFD